MHICKICLWKTSQLRKHLTITHKISIEEYLLSSKDKELFYKIEDELKIERSKNSPWSIKFYLNKGYSEEESRLLLDKKIKDRKKPKTNPYQIEYYTNKGFTKEESEVLILEHKSKTGKMPNKDDLVRKFGDTLGEEIHNNRQITLKGREDKFLSTFEDLREAKIVRSLNKGWGGSNQDWSNSNRCSYGFDSYSSYSGACAKITELSLVIYSEIIDPSQLLLGRKYGKNGNTLDHIFSKYGGFYHKIDPFKVASLGNLRVIPEKENLSKGQFCITTVEEVNSLKTLLDEDFLSEKTKERIKYVFNRKSKSD